MSPESTAFYPSSSHRHVPHHHIPFHTCRLRQNNLIINTLTQLWLGNWAVILYNNIVSHHISAARTYALTQRQMLCSAGGAHFGTLIGAWHRLVNSFPSKPHICLASFCSKPRLKAERKNCRFVYCSCAKLYAMYYEPSINCRSRERQVESTLCMCTMSVLPL
jgi:hypothetical protein